MSTIFITGANRGLGFAFVKAYLKHEWQVIATYRNADSSSDLIQLKSQNKNLQTIKLDLNEFDSFKQVKTQLKDQSIDVLLHNAGVFGAPGMHFGSVDYEHWLPILRVNMIAPLLLSQQLIENISHGQKRIIAAISSKMGLIRENELGGRYPYRTSKAGLNMIIKSMSLELKERDICCVAFNPGWVKTGIGGENAPMTPEQSASKIQSLLDNVSMRDSGKFFDYSGSEIDW